MGRAGGPGRVRRQTAASKGWLAGTQAARRAQLSVITELRRSVITGGTCARSSTMAD